MKTKIVHLIMALALVAALVPIVAPQAATPAEAQGGTTWEVWWDQLTSDSPNEFRPAVSADGSQIAYYNSPNEIWVMDADGSNQQKVADGQWAGWMPVSGNLTYVNGNETYAYVPGDTDTLLYTHPNGGLISSLEWSPDESQVAITGCAAGHEPSGKDIIYLLDTSSIPYTASVLYNPATSASYPTWSPDGSKVAFTSRGASSSNPFNIYSINSDKNGLTQLTTSGGLDPNWSPTLDKIVYEYNSQLWVMDGDGSNKYQLTRQLDRCFMGKWSPGSTHVVLARQEGNRNIWAASYPHASIQGAIDDALEGDTILVGPGIYPENIDIDKSLTIQSTGDWGNTTISGQDGDVVDVEGFAGTLLLDGFEITGGGRGIDIVDLDFTADVTISNCFIWQNGDGIHVGRVAPESNLTIEDNIITHNGSRGIDFGVGMSIVEGTVTIQRNVIGAWYGDGPEGWLTYFANGSDGIYVWQLGMTGTMTIDQNIIAENGGGGSDGIHVWKVGAYPDAEHPGRGLHITNNAIGAWQFSYLVDEVTYSGNVTGNAWDGIEVEISLPATFVNIEHNAISENMDDGIELGPDGVQGTVRIVENIIGAWTLYPADMQMPGGNATFGGNQGEGIEISGISPSGNVLIRHNLIAENISPMSGIHVQGDVAGVLDILNNAIGAYTDDHDQSYGGNAGEGVYINEVNDPAVVTIADNLISENTGDGIDIDRIYDKRTTVSIKDNTITKNEDGIDIHEADQDAIVGIVQNTITYQDHGIRMGSDADGIDIVCNLISENEHGIWVKGDWNNISGNEITNNVGAGSGVHLTSGADNNQIHNNNITGNSAQISAGVYSYGVYKEGGTPVDATNNYWGAADGPGGSGPGSGDSVNDLVTYDPFLSAPADTCFAGEAGEPEIDKKGASPSTISLWTDEMFRDMWDDGGLNFSVGPSAIEQPDFALPVWYVVAHDDDSGVASVTINLRALLFELIPEEKLQKFLDQLQELPPERLDPALDEWQLFMDEIEAWPLKYKAEYDCWHEPGAITDLLRKTVKFFDDWLDWEGYERKQMVAEIMGQELNLGQFDVEVTVTDFKGNPSQDFITITVVDFQMPVAEGWNLRSTWLTLENNGWQDIVATMQDEGNVDSILRWNSQLQRWEGYAETAGAGWYNGVTKVAEAVMLPLESYWIHSLMNDQIGLITRRDVTAPPSRQMYAGWNLIGAALNWQQPSLRVNDALLSIYEAEGLSTGYTQVLSVDQYSKWYEDLWICDSWLKYPEYYQKKFKQETWVFTRDFTESGPRMTRGGGYWVFMANPAVLGGFNSTPLPMDFWHNWWQNSWWD